MANMEATTERLVREVVIAAPDGTSTRITETLEVGVSWPVRKPPDGDNLYRIVGDWKMARELEDER